MTQPVQLYADTVNMKSSQVVVILTLFQDEGNGNTTHVATLRIPTLVAKQIAMILRKQIKDVEERVGVLQMTQDQMNQLGIHPEDW